jgi:pimeloyl-ACP methyl ester carboxylesterase
MVVSLHGVYQTPDMQIDWWAGNWKNGMRWGHATRHGYIVVAPEWNPPEVGLPDYDFSVFSHAAILCAVKDAFRRFSVDTDKVFISGHGAGGTAAWDIALAHPDLWAGAIPFNAVASKYIDTYESAIRYMPLYLVWGEMEGAGLGTSRKWIVNAPVLNRYLQSQSNPGDVTVVRYIGRGLEGFSEEILHVLDWMKLRQRNLVPFDFKVETMRPWDSFFWWVEMPDLPTDVPRNMADPVDFPARRMDARPATVESKLYRGTNTVSVTTKPKVANTIVSLTPDMIDFNTRVTVKVNEKNYHPANGIVEPNIETILEDVRTRCDRLHPFWAMLDGR